MKEPRLIDAEKWLKERRDESILTSTEWGSGYECGRSDMIESIAIAPTIDAVPVVRCAECVSHGNCLTEDTFRIARIENPYCCGGKRREVDGNG